MFKALADPTRRAILDELTDRDGQTLFEICARLTTKHGLAKALRFYTEVLGFVKKEDIPLGEHSWLTVVSPEDPNGTELSLEPDEHPAARPFKRALVEDGIPFTSFAVGDVAAEHRRLSALGVRFTQPPTDMGPVTTAVFDDTCGNLIQIATDHR